MNSTPRAPSPVRAWFFLIGFAMRRQLRVPQLVILAVGMLVVATGLVVFVTQTIGWGMMERVMRPGMPTNAEVLDYVEVSFPPNPGSAMVSTLVGGILDTVRVSDATFIFPQLSRWVVFAVFVGFLMPLWTLSFATSAIGAERESRSFIWMTTRPLPRSAVYLAHFFAVLPWCLGLNLIGLFALCAAGGPSGQEAFRRYWEATLFGTIAFTALFHFIGAIFRRPAVVALLYSFFFETLAGDMPGTLKRLSISFYTRCMMYDEARKWGFEPERPEVFQSVGLETARWVLIGTAVVLTAFGMWWFARSEYKDDL